jgi:hypothetical protein
MIPTEEVVICRWSEFVENSILAKCQTGGCGSRTLFAGADHDRRDEHGEVQQCLTVRPHAIWALIGERVNW